ncbi:DNA replication/repair protein RecF [Halalkalibacterium ligniniphilum]|uniref:DNA replication/repair protein RecF n=1 Tax=Halalkalibacterium ligniniphilum TaxID=1134413 RepID=UPI0003457621|nr:DNA replication/repair protein RecF [Halalkalibacterium ligniniphilum]
MYIKTLTLRHYRNYEQLEVAFQQNVNVILGENAQGKTNAIEAIYLLAMAKSHRTPRDKELIRWDEAFAKIEGSFEKRNGPLSLDVVISTKGKKVKVNGLEQRRLSDYIGAVNVVMFGPEDLNLVKGSPQIRRRFLDMELGQMSPIYLHKLATYQKILQQRNSLLKNLQGQRQTGPNTMLDVLTEQLIGTAIEVTKKRFEFLQLLQGWAEEIHREISRGKEALTVTYLPSVDVSEGANLSKIEEAFYQEYEAKKEREVQRGTTLFGPHRDDLAFSVNEKDVQTYGSQGQQRTTALSLKLAEIELMKETVGEYPILLLDDVLSELDDYRQSHLLHAIQHKVQTFVTTTSVDGIDHQTLREAATYTVEQGTLRRKE